MTLKKGKMVYLLFAHYQWGGDSVAQLYVNGDLIPQENLCAPPPLNDAVPPAAPGDLLATAISASTLKLAFKSPGDDGDQGKALAYDLRISDFPITPENFERAPRPDFTTIPTPAVAGTDQTITVRNLPSNRRYYLALRAVDHAFPPNVGPPAVVSGTTLPAATTVPPPPAHGLLEERWNGRAEACLDRQKTLPRYPDFPDSVKYLPEKSGFKAVSNFGDNYLRRLSGYIQPDQTGNYTFWVAGDDGFELWLSTDDSPTHLRKVAAATGCGWTTPNQFDRFPSQRSAPVALEAGKRYYIQALNTDAGGDDHLSVAWSPPGASDPVVIPGQYLIPADHTGDRSRIEGIVTGADGHPVKNAWVWANTGGHWADAMTKEDGSYSLLAYSGSVALTVSLPDFPEVSEAFGTVAVAKDEIVSRDLRLRSASVGVMSLRSADLKAAGVPGWSFLQTSTSEFELFATTDDSGNTIPDPDVMAQWCKEDYPITGESVILPGDTWLTDWDRVPGNAGAENKYDPQPGEIGWDAHWIQALKFNIPAALSEATAFRLRDFNVEDLLLMACLNGQKIAEVDVLLNLIWGDYTWNLSIPRELMKTDGSANNLVLVGYDDLQSGGMTNTAAGGPLITALLPANAVPLKKGDLNGNGKVDVQDATLSLRLTVGLMSPTEDQKASGDVNGDGKLDLQDTIAILKAAASGSAL
jgi:hypothetical protein